MIIKILTRRYFRSSSSKSWCSNGEIFPAKSPNRRQV